MIKCLLKLLPCSSINWRILRGLLVLILVIGWIFSGWPQIWENPRIPSEIKKVQAAATVIFLTATSTITWVVPSDWNSSDNTIEVIGGGGGGITGAAGGGGVGGRGGGGAGAGGYSKITNTTALTPSSTVTIQIGNRGVGGASPTAGTDTYLCNATINCASIAGTAVQVGSKGGNAGTATAGGAGGLATGGVGTTKFNGGTGGGSTASAGKGGGGGGGGAGAGGTTAAGSNGVTGGGAPADDGVAGGAGGAGGTASGGTAGTAGSAGVGGPGGIGGNGGTGTVWDATHGAGGGSGGGGGGDRSSNGGAGGTNAGLYGAGGGGGGGAGRDGGTPGTGAAGRAGIIVITYTVPSTDQNAYRWRNDNGTESTATWKNTENLAITGVSLTEIIRLRLEIEEINSGAITANSELQFSSDATSCTTGTWTTIDTSTTAWRVTASANITNGDPTTNQLTSSALTFIAGRIFDTQNQDTTGVVLDNLQSEWEWAIRGDGAATSTTYRFRATDAGTVLNTYTNCAQLTTATGGEATISCSTNISSTSFGTLTTASVFTSSPNASTTISCSNTSSGCALYVADAGNGSNPGLATTTPAYLIPSNTATLSAGAEGYGIQATTTASGSGGTLGVNATYNKINNDVGGLSLSVVTLASSTIDATNREIVATHKAAISNNTLSGNYSDTITYSCTVN